MILLGKENALALCMSLVADSFVIYTSYECSLWFWWRFVLTCTTFTNRYIGGNESEGHFTLINQACSM